MPHGLFDYEDAMEPMGLSPAYDSPYQGAGYLSPNAPDNYSGLQIGHPSKTEQKLVYWGVENAPVVTLGMGLAENAPTQNQYTDAKVGFENVSDPRIVTRAIPEEVPRGNVMTMAIPESGAPSNPSGQCPAGYTSVNTTPASGGGLQTGTPNTFGFDGQGNPIPVEGGAFNYGSGGGGGGGSVFGSSGRTNEMPIRSSVSATAPSTWSGSQQQYTGMLNQLGINTAR